MRIESFVWLVGVTYAGYVSFEEGILRGDCKNVRGPPSCFNDCMGRGGALEKVWNNGCSVVSDSITGWHLGNQWNEDQANDWITLNQTTTSNCDRDTSKCQIAEDCQSWCAGTKGCAWFSWFARGGTEVQHRCQGKSQEQVDAALLHPNSTACSNVPRRCDMATCLVHNGATNTCIWRSQNIVGGTLVGAESLIKRLETVHRPPSQQPTPKKIVAITVANVTDTPTATPTAESNTDATDPTLPTEATNGTIPTEATSQIQDAPSTKASGGSTATKVGAIVGAAGGAGILGVGAYAAFRTLGTGASSMGQAQFETLNETNQPNEINRETSVEVSEFI